MRLLPDRRIVAWGAVFALASALGAAEAPSTVVTTVDDVIDPDDGRISLREAIAYAGTNGLGTTITFELPPDEWGYVSNYVVLDDRIEIAKSLVFESRNLTSRRIMSYEGAGFRIAPGARVVFNGGEVRGVAPGEDITDTFGGGFHNQGDLTLKEVSLVYCGAGRGGAVANEGDLRLENCVLSHNRLLGRASALYNLGSVTCVSCSFGDNHSVFIEGVDGEAVYNRGVMRMEKCVFFGRGRSERYAAGMLVNEGTAVFDGACFRGYGAANAGSAISNGADAVLQLNNVSFFDNDAPMVSCEAGGEVLMMNSSFSGNVGLAYVDHPENDPANWGGKSEADVEGESPASWAPCVRIDGLMRGLRVYNCAFDMDRTNAFAVAVADLRGCAFATPELPQIFSRARLRRLGENSAFSLMPVVDLAVRAPGLRLRKTDGKLVCCIDGNWTPTDVEIPYLAAESLTVDMFGDSRGESEAAACVPGATADFNGPESLSTVPTIEQDVVDPYDGEISLREALSYAPYVVSVSAEEGGGNRVGINLGDATRHYQVTNGPIVVDSSMDTVSFFGDGAQLDGGGVSGILEFKGLSAYFLQGIVFMNAAGDGDGGAVNMIAPTSLDIYECAFMNCATEGSGGAVHVAEGGELTVYGPELVFEHCWAGSNGGAIACEGTLTSWGGGWRFTNCSARGRGGAAYLLDAMISEVRFEGNQADEGGALWAERGSWELVTFTGNSATSRGGALGGSLADLKNASFVDNHAPEGAAMYLSGANRKLFYNVSFIGNTGSTSPGAAVMASEGGTLRLANCDAWGNAPGVFAATVDGATISAFNSILPEQPNDGSLLTDGVTRLDFASDFRSTLLCEDVGTPCLFTFFYDEDSTGGNYYHLDMRYTGLVARHEVPATSVGVFTAADGGADLAYYDRLQNVWRDAAGREVTAEVDEITTDLRGKNRGDKFSDGREGYGLGAISHMTSESISRYVTTLVDGDDPYDMRVSMREAFCRILGEWDRFAHAQLGDDDDVRISFDLTGTASRAVMMTNGVLASVGNDSFFVDEHRLVLDGACPDGTCMVIDLCGGPLFLKEGAGLRNNFVFRNLVFRNAVVPANGTTSGVFDCPSTGGSLVFENCVFENCQGAGDRTGVVRSDKALAFSNCVFRDCAGGTGAVVASSRAMQLENCVVEGTLLHGSGVIKAGSAQVRNLTVRGTTADEGVETLLWLSGSGTNMLLNASFAETTWRGPTMGCVVACAGGVTDFGNVTSGGHGGCRFLEFGPGAQARILNSVIEGDCEGAVVTGMFRSAPGRLVESTYGDCPHAVLAPPNDANPGSPVGVYDDNGVRRLAVLVNGTWQGADGVRLAANTVTVEEFDIFGISRLRGGEGIPCYTCGALSDYMAELVVTTVEDVVDPSDGVVSFREAVQALLAGQHRLNGDRMVSFAIPGVRNPVIRWAEPFAVTNAAAFNPERPLMVDGATERGQVTFDGERVRSLFRVGEGAALELAHCTLTRGHSRYGGAVGVDGGGHLCLRGVTVRDSYASAMGGGVFGGDVWAENCTFSNCVSDNGGGALALDAYGSFMALNCAFVGNEAVSGGAVYGRAGVGIAIARSSFRGNRAIDGAGVFAGARSVVEIADSVLCDNQVDFEYGGVVCGEMASIALDRVTTWNNLRTGSGTPTSLLEGWDGMSAIRASLVSELPSAYTEIADAANSVFGLNGDWSFFVVSNGVPYTAMATVEGVTHAFRLPSEKARHLGTGELGLDLFGNARTAYTRGAVDILSEPPVGGDSVAEITHPDFQEGVDQAQLAQWMEGNGVDVAELNVSEQALASYLLGTPLLEDPPELTITAISELPDGGTWRVTVHAVATIEGVARAVRMGEQVGGVAVPLVNGKLTVSYADALSGPWTIQSYAPANLEFTSTGDAIVTVKTGRFVRAVITK